MANLCSQPKRAVAQYDHGLSLAVVPSVPPNQPMNEVPKDKQLEAVGNGLQQASQSKRCTKILAVVQRPRDQIILTEDDKGKQMLVQRAHNVAKIQRKQRDEHFKPFDLRPRGQQRPVAVGVVGRLDNSAPDDAMWRTRQLMQNVQSQHSDRHRPLQEQEEQRIAEETRLRALAKNEKKMKSYRVDMGNMLENQGNPPPNEKCVRTLEIAVEAMHNTASNMQDIDMNGSSNDGKNASQEDGNNDFLGDDINGSSIDGNNASPEDRNNDFLGDDQLVDVNSNLTLSNPIVNSGNERNRLRMLEIRERQQGNMSQLIDDTADSRRLEAERKAEEARQKALKENERKMKSYKVTMGTTLGTADNIAVTPAGVHHASSSCSARSLVTKSTTSFTVASTSPATEGPTLKPVSKQEIEKRRQEVNRQKMLAAREKQQQDQLRIMHQTAETRRLEAKRKAEEARQKALKENERKMKSYKMTLGYTLEDYVQDNTSSNQNYKERQDNEAFANIADGNKALDVDNPIKQAYSDEIESNDRALRNNAEQCEICETTVAKEEVTDNAVASTSTDEVAFKQRMDEERISETCDGRVVYDEEETVNNENEADSKPESLKAIFNDVKAELNEMYNVD